MGSRIVMPKFTETMGEGTILKWYKKEGDSINIGEPLVEIEGDKLTYDVESTDSGRLLKIFRSENSSVPVGEVIAFIGREGEQAPPPPSLRPEVLSSTPRRPEAKNEARRRAVASPLAKKLAQQYGIDLAQIDVPGTRDRITEAVVRGHIESETLRKIERRKIREVIPLVRVRKTIAEKMMVSSRIPRITLVVEADASQLLGLAKDHGSSEAAQVSPTHIIVKAVAAALKMHPIMNSTLEGDEIRIFEDVNVGVAVATDYGLVVPVVKDAYGKPIAEVAKEVRSLAEKARMNSLTKEDVEGGTFTITNLGMSGANIFTPLINPPECGILGIGSIIDRPVAVNGKISVKPTISLCLSFDHRIVDGTPAAKFLETLKQTLENPTSLSKL